MAGWKCSLPESGGIFPVGVDLFTVRMTILFVIASVFAVFVVSTVRQERRGQETSRGPMVAVGAILGLLILSVPASHLYWQHNLNAEAAALRPIMQAMAEANASGASMCSSAALGNRIGRLYRRRKWARYFAGDGPVPPYATFPGFLGPFRIWVPADADLGMV